MMPRMTAQPSAASIIVPTYREADNLRKLVPRIFRAMREAHIDAELIIVDDDSRDGTEEIVAKLQADNPVRLIVRKGQRGLATAVLRGLEEARFDNLVVLDADLQHPPEMIPALLRRLTEEDTDFVIGSRYCDRGAIEEEWPLVRRLVSRVATLLARPLTPVSDPMSGFFALTRDTLRKAERLSPMGYKIGLELYVKAGCTHPCEVPIRFAKRAAGASKLDFKEQIRYLRHLFRLYRFRFPCRFWTATVVGVALVAYLLFLGGD